MSKPPSATYDYDSRGFWRVRLPSPEHRLTLLFERSPHGFGFPRPRLEVILRRHCDRCRGETAHRQTTEARSCRRVVCLECSRDTYRSPAGVEVFDEGRAPPSPAPPEAP